jgi:acrylyl-CoA reductase (NADPH)
MARLLSFNSEGGFFIVNFNFLIEIGANEILSREDVTGEKIRALDKQLWAAAVDPVGGKTLASILSKITYNGSVAVSGLTGGGDVPTTVFPFILRGVNLLGIDSVYCPMETRIALWKRMATDFKPDNLLKVMKTEVSLEELPDYISSILKGEARGRTIVKL